ncbi:hypothetical protein Pelo_5994 [Pelomyxa schiedti]|nr:hypothetical protein Pelo_5994 [Pelomyxa schiedti]
MHHPHSQSSPSLAKVTSDSVVKLNVGGEFFATSLSTLTSVEASFFYSMFTGRFTSMTLDGCFFVDRDPHMFRHILNFHRGQNVPVPHLCNADLAQLADDSAFYGLPRLEEVLQQAGPRVLVPAAGTRPSPPELQRGGVEPPRKAQALPLRSESGPSLQASAKSAGVVRASILTAAPSGGAFDGWWCFHAGSHRPSGYAYDRYCVWVPDNIIPRVPTSDSPGLASFDPPVESAVTTSTATSVTNSTTAVATTPGTSTTPKTPCKKRPVTRVAEGSIVKVAVEVDSGVISFGVDDSDYAVAYSGVDVHSEPLFPCVIMYDDGDTVELVPPEEFDFA